MKPSTASHSHWLAFFLKRPANPVRISPTIQHANNHSLAGDHSVINRKRKTPRQKPMKPETNAVYSGVEHERVDFRKDASKK
jgi:hypothetical protein